MKQNWERQKNMEKFFEVFWIWTKTNIADINSSSSDDEEAGAEYKVKRISNSGWCKNICRLMFFKIGVRPETLLKRDSSTGVFLPNLRNLLEHLFLQNTSTLMAASCSKQCKPMKTLKVYPAEKRNDMPERYFKVSVSR